jgi:hypothetical protein
MAWVGLLLLAGAPGQAASPNPPRNDEPTGAKKISHLPASLKEITTNATVGASERQPAVCSDMGQTVWFTYTPKADGVVQADTIGSIVDVGNYDTVIAVYTFDGTVYTDVACNDDAPAGHADPQNGNSSYVSFPVTAGTTYYFQVGSYHTDMFTGANLVLNVYQ